ncbi:hypothetical protein SEA_KELA_236 [Streptomyces phage Kela]|nr:hypothetical protein SEA_KELA_236 [Streptomyces phage Kela]
MNLDPSELGWHEFWLRIGVIFFVLSVALLVALIVGRVILTFFDLARWMQKKIAGKREEEMSPVSLHRALLKLVPPARRSTADKLLRRLLAADSEGAEVFVAEYDGRPATVHTSVENAFAACAVALSEEPGPGAPWDWFEDEYGWVMRRVDPDTGKQESLLGGKVTRTEVEP